jgi:hypothetical protein
MTLDEDPENDAWIGQLENDLVQFQDIERSTEEARKNRLRLIDAKAMDFFKELAKIAKRAADQLRLEYQDGRMVRDIAAPPTDYSFVVTRRHPYASLDADLNIAAHSIKATYTRSLALGAANKEDELFEIKLTPQDDLCLKRQNERHPLPVSKALEKMFRSAFLPLS